VIAPADIEDLERAIVAAVAPEQVVEMGGWLVPLDDGAIGRAKSAVPLAHAADADAIADVEQIYRAMRLPPAFRLAETDGLVGARDELRRRGYVPQTPTIMKLGTAAGLAGMSEAPAQLLAAPDAGWVAAFTGDGFDPDEGAQRVRNLTRSPDVLFGAVREGERTIAVGVVSFGRGWAGIHGMRTAPDQRRRGHAARILAAFGRAAAARGIERAVLQVVEDNPARSLYRAAGFTQAWRYCYWSLPSPPASKARRVRGG
jgi:GNAT superfamily N-acetyltransferase